MAVIWILQNLMSQLLGSFTVLASLMWSGQETIYVLAYIVCYSGAVHRLCIVSLCIRFVPSRKDMI